MNIEQLQYVIAILTIGGVVVSVAFYISRIEGKGKSRDDAIKALHDVDSEVSKRIDALEDRMNEFSQVRTDIALINGKFDNLKEWFDKMEKRFEAFFKQMNNDK